MCFAWSKRGKWIDRRKIKVSIVILHRTKTTGHCKDPERSARHVNIGKCTPRTPVHLLCQSLIGDYLHSMSLRSEEIMIVIILVIIILIIVIVAMTYGIFYETAFSFLNLWDLCCPSHILCLL